MGKEDKNVYWALSGGPRFAGDALVHEETRGTQDHPALAIDGSGTAWVAWEDDPERKKTASIRVRSSAPGSKDRLLSDPAEGAASFPALAVGAGIVGVAYEVKLGEERKVIFRVVEGG